MDSQPTTTESKHNYQSAPWTRAPSNSSTPRQTSASVTDTSGTHGAPSHLELLPILFPQQSSLYQAQLLNYNKLISPGRGGGGGLQTPPLAPPVVSAPHIQAAPRSRSSSKVSNKDNQTAKQPSNQNCHGNRGNKNADKTERAVTTMVKEPPQPKMPPKQGDHLAHPPTSRVPPRSSPRSSHPSHLPAQASSSVPSTPHQHARNFSCDSREPSPNAAQNHSPRSAYSETNSTLPSLRPLPPRLGGCVYETAMVRGRRRMPYSIGTDRLEKIDPDKVKSRLSEDEERKLSTDMRELYDRLTPTEKVKDNRARFVRKLEKIFNDEWPGHKIGVHLFGSSGNKLCSDDSDVDICITTDWKEMENVCMIAELLAKCGMEKVVCVSSAKVPIVKIWDPELRLACDMNVNNTLALENTRMVLTYVDIDERVRPLAMIIKYWTRRRIINDAAFGGTLSSYTWICMIITFLQLRSAPVLPALHQRPQNQKRVTNGRKSEFADDMDKLQGFGRKNKETLGQLLFHFFRFYAHEFDYDKFALSVRLGKMITKEEKKWQTALNNMLCIEEPFNIVRNLGNTADDTSFRGLHMELRRAFDLIAGANLEECCEQFIFPKEEERVWQKPAQAPRPVMLRSSSQQHSGRGGRGNYRGNRQGHRNGPNNRRASSSVTYENSPMFIASMQQGPSPQDLQWYQQQQQQQQQQQFPFHSDMINSTLNALQIQEHSLRFQLYTQSQAYAQQQALAFSQRMQGGPGQGSTDRSRTNSFDNPPLTAPIRPEMYVYPVSLQPAPFYATQHPGMTTLPSSPNMSAAVPEFRRSLHRTGAHADSTSSGSGPLRSQSQPASRTPMPGMPPHMGYPGSTQPMPAPAFPPRHINGVPIPSFIPDENADMEFDDGPTKAASDVMPEEEGTRYIGYYVSESSSPARQNLGVTNGIPSFGDLGQGAQGRRRLSTDQLPQSILDRRIRRTSRSPSPLGHARAFSVGTNTAPLPSVPFPLGGGQPAKESRPVVVNGSAFKPSPITPASRVPTTFESMATDEVTFENPLRIHNGLGINGNGPNQLLFPSAPIAEPSPLVADRPVVVNGSTHSPLGLQNAGDVHQFSPHVASMGRMNQVPYAAIASGNINGMMRLSPRQQVLARQQQYGSSPLAPLDLAVHDPTFVPELQHLSPVHEARTPSPTVVRKFDGPFSYAGVSQEKAGSSASVGAPRKDSTHKPAQKGHQEAASIKQDSVTGLPSNPRVNGISSRENGHVRGAKSESDNTGGWQKPKSRKKTADLKAAANIHSQSERPPRNESDRKGG